MDSQGGTVRLDFVWRAAEKLEFDELSELAHKVVREKGFLLVDFSMRKTGTKYMIRLLVDRPGRITIMECVRISKAFQDAMDQELVMEGENYRLEVSSPGVGRLLSREVDWVRTVGRKLSIRLETEEFVGYLEEYDSDILKFRNGRVIPVSEIVSAVEVLDMGSGGS